MNFFAYPPAFIEGVGGPEMVLILVIVLVLFGGQKLPELARGLGKSMREFKKAAAGVEEEFKRALEEDEHKKSPPKYIPAPATVAALPPAEVTAPTALTTPAPPPAPDTGPAAVIPAATPTVPATSPVPAAVPPVARTHGQADV